MALGKSSSNGHTLLSAFDTVVAEHSERADARAADVDARIVELESELTALRTLQIRLRNAAL